MRTTPYLFHARRRPLQLPNSEIHSAACYSERVRREQVLAQMKKLSLESQRSARRLVKNTRSSRRDRKQPSLVSNVQRKTPEHWALRCPAHSPARCEDSVPSTNLFPRRLRFATKPGPAKGA